MDVASLGSDHRPLLAEILAYLNLSSGAADSRFRGNMVAVCTRLEELGPGTTAWRELPDVLQSELGEMRATSSAAFRETGQVEAAILLALGELPSAYRRHHQDLLSHQADDDLFRPLFLARCCEAVLRQGPPWDEGPRIVAAALAELNDYTGYRPVAVLHNGRRMEPYDREHVCPIPLYFRGVGVDGGPYRPLIRQTLDVLAATDRDLCEAAGFDLELLDELALDPRAYDFDHPVNKRPNHLFGLWDPHSIDNRGRYRRFVLHGVTLDAILSRVDSPGDLPRDEALWEAGVVLAGVILMASGTSGWGPGAHDSSTTLANLLPRIVRYRDAFYRQWLTQASAARAGRLRDEAAQLRQPFAGARQHLNRQLARLRATQMQHVCLAQLFARMGYPEASLRQAEVVPVASARMLCRIDCRLAQGHHALDRGELERAAACLPDIESLLQRSIDCGALVDPWNVLGFGGQFSLFPALENTVRDHRVDVLVRLLERIFGLQARVWKEAASAGQNRLAELVDASFAALARWWDQFAVTSIDDIDGVSGQEAWSSAAEVAKALSAWYAAGEAAGDIAFWRQHVGAFAAPRAYALVVETLLERHDDVAAAALLVQWVSQAETMALDDGDNSFHQLAAQWLGAVLDGDAPAADGRIAPLTALARWQRVRRFFDYLEANAEEYWSAPRFAGGGAADDDMPGLPSGEGDEEDAGGLFDAAYEDVVYRDSASDGQEGDIVEGGPAPSDHEMDLETKRLEERLAFLATLARLWRMAAAADWERSADDSWRAALQGWFAQARRNEEGLLRLLGEIHRHPIPGPTGSHDSLVEYDRRRAVKESQLEEVVTTCVTTRDAACVLRTRLRAEGGPGPTLDLPLPGWREPYAGLIRAALAGDAATVRRLFPDWLNALRERPLLYLPIGKRGDPARVLEARSLLRAVRDLLRALPRLGLLAEALALLDVAQECERLHPVGPGGVTEFDRLFQDGLTALVEALVEASAGWHGAGGAATESADADLVECLRSLTESLLGRWLSHSNNLRLSALEQVADEERFAAVATFVGEYGGDLFTPRFLNVGNLRAILHQGVDAFLTKLAEDPEPDFGGKLLAALGRELPREEAVAHLKIVAEAIVENFAEYRDYNTTTTQSDHGEMLHVLLDYLRLKASYERVAWNLRPIALAHEVLVRRGRMEAAALWRQSLVERTAEIAERHLRAAGILDRKHGMRLATVSDRLTERFVRPLEIDRLKALVRPAIDESRRGLPAAAFATLEDEAAAVAAQPGGAGLDVPGWIVELQEEVTVASSAGQRAGAALDWTRQIGQRPIGLDDARRQIG